MAIIFDFPSKLKPKPVQKIPRGPRGKVLIRPKQTWVQIHNRREVIIIKVLPENKRHRIYFKEKKTHSFCEESLSETTFRSGYKILEDYLEFAEETTARFINEARRHGYTIKAKLELVPTVNPLKGKRPPKVGSVWVEITGVHLKVKKHDRENGEKLWIAFTLERNGHKVGFGVQEYEREKWYERYTQVV